MTNLSLFPKFLPRLLGCGLLIILIIACQKKKENATTKSEGTAVKERRAAGHAASPAAEHEAGVDIAQKIETLTGGAQAKLVWLECQNPRETNTPASMQEQLLKGFDTRDGLGERVIVKIQGDYARPLISADGQTILYTLRCHERKDKMWTRQAEIFRTDWKGTAPVRLAAGSVVDSWRDPVTQVVWVYAVQEWDPSRKLDSDAKRLVRFPLDNPEKTELIYDETRVDPDNIQLSRDGRRGSGSFPWPNAGVFHFDEESVSANKLRNGCWPSLSPDDSYVSWIFDGSHKSATFYADEGTRSWVVDFTPPDTGHNEMFHPRWSNHPRYFVITGPYGGKISTGGLTAEIYLGRFSPTLDKVESWVKVTGNSLADSYPDAWIEGGDKAQLSGFKGKVKAVPQPSDAPPAWPVSTEGVVFLWRDKSAQNTWRTPDGRNHEVRIQNHGTARFGRHLEMLVDGGHVGVEQGSAQEAAVQQLRDKPSATLEALVLPRPYEAGGNPATSFLFRGPNFSIGIRGGLLVLDQASGSAWESSAPLPATPFHLVVIRNEDTFDAFVNGTSLKLNKQSAVTTSPATESITFGGDWNGGLRNIALYGRALAIGETTANSASMLREAARFSTAPSRVKLRAKLVETTSPPTFADIAPYTGSLVACVYEVGQVTAGEFKEKRILVKHWGLLNRLPVAGFPLEIGKTYDLTVEKESDHPELKGERVSDDTTAFDLGPWFDVTSPVLAPEKP